MIADVIAVACAEAFRGDGEIFGSGMGTMPMLGARLAKATFEPDLLLTDGLPLLIWFVLARDFLSSIVPGLREVDEAARK